MVSAKTVKRYTTLEDTIGNCPNCLGHGYLLVTIEGIIDVMDGSPDVDIEDCKVCDGEGNL